ncbi:IS5 family transposase [Streptomyces sp. NPDC051218]|uniref:IS5 family transposase n=1 Tax=Streptomyces sp. NPDC051218 TaxID=3365645 RepID=UPI00378AFA9F
MTDPVEHLVPDELWVRFWRVVPPTEVLRPQGGGPRRAGDREPLAVILFVATSDRTLAAAPTSSVRAGRRSTDGSLNGAGPASGQGSTASSLTNSALAASSTGRGARSTLSISGQRKGATDRTESDRPRQAGIENHLITDRNGFPLSLDISAANMHDSQGLQPLVRGIPPIRSPRGPRRRPAKLHADKGYDYDHLRRWLRKRGIRHRIARKGIESSQRLGRHRWVVERTVSWLAGCRRLHRRYERKAEHFSPSPA